MSATSTAEIDRFINDTAKTPFKVAQALLRNDAFRFDGNDGNTSVAVASAIAATITLHRAEQIEKGPNLLRYIYRVIAEEKTRDVLLSRVDIKLDVSRKSSGYGSQESAVHTARLYFRSTFVDMDSQSRAMIGQVVCGLLFANAGVDGLDKPDGPTTKKVA